MKIHATILDVTVASVHSNRYHGWPTIARRRCGELLAVCSGDRQEHLCPFGRVQLIRSLDGGVHWGPPVTLTQGQTVINAERMESDNIVGEVRLQGQVRGILYRNAPTQKP